MPERIPELDQLASEAREVTMLPAVEIRRRGDRRRTTRNIAMTAGVVIVALAAGFGIWQSPLLNDNRSPDWANTAVPEPTVPTIDPTDPTVDPTDPSVDPTKLPSETPLTEPTQESSSPVTQVPPAVIPPTWDNSPTAEMLFPDEAPGEIYAEYEGLGEAGHGLCDPGQYAEPSTILTRAYATPGYPPYIDAIVFGYDSVDAASAGFDLIYDEAVGCQRAMEEAHGLSNTRIHDATDEVPFDLSVVDDARMAYVTYMGIYPNSDQGMFGQTVVLQAGERVLWLTQAFEGMDDNCAPTPSEYEQQCQLPASIPEVLPRLVQ